MSFGELDASEYAVIKEKSLSDFVNEYGSNKVNEDLRRLFIRFSRPSSLIPVRDIVLEVRRSGRGYTTDEV